MKRIISLFIIISICLSFVSCNFNAPTINGISVKKYRIVYDAEGLDYNLRAAEYIRDEIKERSGVELEIVDDSAEKREFEIVVGETSREISAQLDAECEGLEFAMLVRDGSVALEADYFIIAAAAYYFIDTYVFESGYAITLEDGESVHKPITRKAKNFIMLIGDGMGFYHTQSFEYMKNNTEFSDGEDFFYGYLLPYQGESRTDSLDGTTDSAAGGTALSCGQKTHNNFVGIDKNGKDIKSLTELAYDKGMSAGVMSTEVDTGATPASFSAHADSRHSIAGIVLSQMNSIEYYGTNIDCGYDYYTADGIVTIEEHITEMLGTLGQNEKGFFLMYEEAHIDKHSHQNDVNSMFQSVVRFNQAIARFMEYAFYNPETFILITADHETGDLYPGASGALTYHSDAHTSKNVPIFAYGMGAELFDGKNVENIQIAHTIASLMGEDNFGDQSKYQRLNK